MNLYIDKFNGLWRRHDNVMDLDVNTRPWQLVSGNDHHKDILPEHRRSDDYMMEYEPLRAVNTSDAYVLSNAFAPGDRVVVSETDVHYGEYLELDSVNETVQCEFVESLPWDDKVVISVQVIVNRTDLRHAL